MRRCNELCGGEAAANYGVVVDTATGAIDTAAHAKLERR